MLWLGTSKLWQVCRLRRGEERFYRLVLQLLSYGTKLAVERQTWYGTAPTCRESMTHLYGALGDTTYSRDETAKSHPFGSDTLHLVPVEHLRNFGRATPSCCGS